MVEFFQPFLTGRSLETPHSFPSPGSKSQKPRTFFGPAQLVADASSLGRSLPPFSKKKLQLDVESKNRRSSSSSSSKQQHSKEESRNIRLHTVPKFAELVVFQKKSERFYDRCFSSHNGFFAVPTRGGCKNTFVKLLLRALTR